MRSKIVPNIRPGMRRRVPTKQTPLMYSVQVMQQRLRQRLNNGEM
jgi:hypothetical protein